MTFLSHDPTDERTHRRALEILDILDRWNERSKGHFSQKRQYARKSFRSLVIVVTVETAVDAADTAGLTRLRVWSRNISQGGISFIFPGQITAPEITLSLDPEEKVWMRGQIVRCRPIHDGFWDYGVKFVGRANPPPPDTAT